MDNVISCYTRQDALDDGMFVDVTETGKEAGIKVPVSVTSNLYHTHIVPTEAQKANGQSMEGRLWDVLNMVAACGRGIVGKMDGNMAIFEVLFSGKKITLWAFIEGTSPTDPSPAMTIMLPSDY